MNLMLEESSTVVNNKKDLLEAIISPIYLNRILNNVLIRK